MVHVIVMTLMIRLKITPMLMRMMMNGDENKDHDDDDDGCKQFGLRSVTLLLSELQSTFPSFAVRV